MKFDINGGTVCTFTVEEKIFSCRAYEDIVYVDNPCESSMHIMNVYLPEAYLGGGDINGYTLRTAPIFMPNTVGGYMPGYTDKPWVDKKGEKSVPNTILRALMHGYVVVSPAIRGRTQKNGKAPACIVDYKAAVRFVRFCGEEFPGDTDKIITNGTSAGGALSSLMGATANHPDYLPYLREIGAKDAPDHVFAASCYCPIINLENADMAYEWQFSEIYEYTHWDGVARKMDEHGIEASKQLAAAFPEYVNSLALKDGDALLTLQPDGSGSFKEYIKNVVVRSAMEAKQRGENISSAKFLSFDQNGDVCGVDFELYARTITRMKPTPAFDSFDLSSPENELFGQGDEPRHFTSFCAQTGDFADPQAVKMLNPMNYITDPVADKCSHWRIRHGERDRDTSLAISAMLALKLREMGCAVDYHSPWDTPHAGDYDLDELFTWIDGICK